MLINKNHPYLALSPDVSELSKPLHHLGITYFSYTKSYKTGERVYLTNSPRRLEVYFAEKDYLLGNTESHPDSYQPQTVFWSTLPNQYLYDKCRMMDIDYGIFMIEPNIDYCEYYGFATTVNNPMIVNTYLSYFGLLKQFTSYFKEKARGLIKEVEKSKLTIPFYKNTLDIMSNCNGIDAGKKIIITEHNIKLSKRQIECAGLLLKGLTANEISSLLNLSPRTIETYIDNIKSKFLCRNKTELIIKLSKFFL